jgi:pimeloyl-ACP methyl ester carboxylesterase
MRKYPIFSQIRLFCCAALLNVSGAPIASPMKAIFSDNHAVPSSDLQSGVIIDPIACKADPTQTYALYIPTKGKRSSMPIIYFFDAHGAGALPLEKYKSLAEEFGFVLIGSNNSKNGNDWSTAWYIWQQVSTDTRIRLNLHANRIYTCGFSGGAKVAGYVALRDPAVRGVIANGAGLPDGTAPGDFRFDFTALAGQGDMNMTDLVSFSDALTKTRTRHHLILFEGSHEWAPESTMRIAFAGLQLDAMEQSLIPKGNAFIDRFIAGSRRRLDLYYKSNQLVNADQEFTLSISYLDGLTDQVIWFKNKLAVLEAMEKYQKQQLERQRILAEEQKTKAEYMDRFQQQDSQYWIKTIRALQAGANIKTSKSGMDQRLLAYLSLAFYSFSNRLISSNQDDAARYFVDLYKIADPTNSEAWYLSAVLLARQKQARPAEEELLKATEFGFRDASRFHHQPEFQTLFSNATNSRIESRMQGNSDHH